MIYASMYYFIFNLFIYNYSLISLEMKNETRLK